jgi:hypothetical protein
MALLTRERLEQRRQRAYKEVNVPDPDPAAAARGEKVTIRLRSMFGGEWVDLIRSLRDNEWRDNNYTALVLAFCLVDDQGKRILSDDDINTAWWKTQGKGFMVEAIDAAMEFSGLKQKASVEDERKNSSEVGSSSNSTELPTDLDIAAPEIWSKTLD